MTARALRLRFWLLAMDAIAYVGGYGSPAYLWCVDRAASATPWFDSGESFEDWQEKL